MRFVICSVKSQTRVPGQAPEKSFRHQHLDSCASRYATLDGLRGVAALTVLITHSSNANMDLIPGVNLTGMGRMGLWLFFVLSAFLLTEQALKAKRQGNYGFWTIDYLSRRFFRIFPLFTAAVAFDYLLGRMSASEVFNALALINGKGIFWTVPPEFQYYFLIPLIALILSLPTLIALILCSLFIIASLAIKLDLAVWPYITLFVTSSLLAYVWQQYPKISSQAAKLAPLTILAFILMIPLVMTFWLPFFDPEAQTDLRVYSGFIWIPRNFSYIYAFFWAPVLFACLLNLKWTRFLASRPMRYIGKISFGLYLLHPVVIVGLQNLGLEYTAIGGVIVLAASIIVAAIAYYLIEEPARIFGYKWVGKLLRGDAEREEHLDPLTTKPLSNLPKQ